MKDLDTLMSLRAKATQGEWNHWVRDGKKHVVDSEIGRIVYHICNVLNGSDAAYIVFLHNTLPAIADGYAKLEAENADLRAKLAEYEQKALAVMEWLVDGGAPCHECKHKPDTCGNGRVHGCSLFEWRGLTSEAAEAAMGKEG